MPGMTPEDVNELAWAADPRLSPDGEHVAYVVTTVDGAANEYRSAVWLARTDGAEEPRRLTAGTKRDAEPRWSPDGSTLAFVSDREGDAAQLYVLPLAGGEPRRLTSHSEDVSQAGWSPDGSQLVYVSRVRDAAYEEEDEGRRRPRRLRRLQYKLDSVGWTGDRRQHLFVVPADGSAQPRQLTEGDFEDVAPAWSPDGATIAFVAAREPDWDLRPVSDIYLVDAGGGEPRRLTQGGGAFARIAWAPDGSRLAAIRYPGVVDDPKHNRIAVVDGRSGEVTLLTAALDRNCGPYPVPREPVWLGERILFTVEDGGNVHLYAVAADGSGAPELLVGGERALAGYDAANGAAVFAAGETTRPSEVSAVRVDGGAAAGERRLSDAAAGFVAGRELIPAERFTAPSSGGAEVDAWVMRPPGFDPSRRYPAILTIHGGPFTQYGTGFFDETQVYAAAGYVVLYGNPRGSSGYSEAWGRAIRGPGELGPGWGSVDYEDCMAVVDEALRRFDFIDPERLGVMGGSYGGFMTSWIVGHTDRFKAAVSERALNHCVSQWGSSDFGWDLKGYTGSYLYEDVDAYLAMSPATYARDIHTPLLLLHSENDLRCPVEQAEQLFVTLRLLKREVELVRFPGESHELTRSGKPVHRVQRFELVLDWFARHLHA